MARWLWRAAWLLLPAALVVRLVWPERSVVIFAVSALSLMPLAKAMGDATGDLAEVVGSGLGALLNATFGNAAELILGVLALSQGHVALVKGSLTGSILGNLLLIAGMAIVAGGIRFPRLRFSRVTAGASVSTLFLAMVALAVPTMLSTTRRGRAAAELLSEEIAVVLIVMYGLSLLFQLRTQNRLDDGRPQREPLHATPGEAAAAQPAGAKRERTPHGWLLPVGKLLGAAAATALASELLVSSLEGTLHTLQLPEMFVGVVIIAIVGNAAEHSTAVLFGHRGDLDVALGVAWESSKQIALFVAPVLVFAGVALGARMDLAFTAFEAVAVGIAVFATALIALDGESHWLEGAFLVAVYLVLGIGFFFVA
jgi:Ca2+:H+ antiporter